MEAYRVRVELQDYVFYATTERGKVYETGHFIHNYALAYALRLAQGDTYTYAQVVQEPHYIEELRPLNGRLYLTPAAPERVAHRLVQWNTLREAYVFPKKAQSLGYPDWGFARILRPGSCFVCYLLVQDPGSLPESPALRNLLEGRKTWVRLGKFTGKARLSAEAAQEVSVREGDFTANALLNWRDVEADPVVCDVVAEGLPTRLIAQARFAGESYYELSFPDGTVRLPLRMRFLARVPEKRRGRAQAAR
ncbi:MAG: type I-D CRISPR-associated protein Cas5/Csc1 [Anaerolineae bacterium]